MIFESEKRIYDKSAGKYLSAEWVLDTDEQTVIHTDENGNVNKRKFIKDCTRYHLNYRVDNNPDSLQKLVNEGMIISYLEELEIKVTDAVNKQAEIWMNESEGYQIALNKGDLYEVNKIGNMFMEKAKEVVYKSVIYKKIVSPQK